MKKYNIIIVTPFYKRNKVLKIYLNHLKENQKELWNNIITNKNDFKKIKKCTIPSEDLTFIIEPYIEKTNE